MNGGDGSAGRVSSGDGEGGRGRPTVVAGVVVAAVVLGAVVLAAAGLGLVGGGEGPLDVDAGLSLRETLGGADTAGYARADGPRDFTFPVDHGPHPDYRNEWWYLTGNLETTDGRRFGYQATFFRSALAPPDGSDRPARLAGQDRAAAPESAAPPDRASAAAAPDSDPVPDPTVPDSAPGHSRWRTRQAWMVHFTVTDPGGERFHALERFEREALGLAGARVAPDFRVWIGGWELSGGPSVFPLSVRLGTDSVAIDLVVEPTRDVVLQGEGGWSRKGPGAGDASYYYSLPRLATTGEVRTPEGTFPVRGTSWLDREWSTSALPEGVVGWDWFALHLDDGRDVMVYRLRAADGAATRFSEGVVVTPGGGDGGARVDRLTVDDFSVEAVDRWESPVDGAAYPSGWRLRIAGHDLDLEIRPVLPDQELDLAFRYWEGAVEVRGRPAAGADPPGGRGYVELTGYAGSRPGR